MAQMTREDMAARLILEDDTTLAAEYLRALQRANALDNNTHCAKTPPTAKMIDYARRRLSWEHRGKRKCWGLSAVARHGVDAWGISILRWARCHRQPLADRCLLGRGAAYQITINNYGFAISHDVANRLANAMIGIEPQMGRASSVLNRIVSSAQEMSAAMRAATGPIAQRIKAMFTNTANKAKSE